MKPNSRSEKRKGKYEWVAFMWLVLPLFIVRDLVKLLFTRYSFKDAICDWFHVDYYGTDLRDLTHDYCQKCLRSIVL